MRHLLQNVLDGVLLHVDQLLELVERTLLAGAILAMAALNIANVLSRNLLGNTLGFVEELNQLLIILVTFVGIAYGVRHARHIRMSAFYDLLQGRARKALLVITQLGTGVLLLYLAWLGLGYVLRTHSIGSVTPALRMPLYLLYIWVPLGFLLGSLQYFLAVLRNLTSPGVHLSLRQPEVFISGAVAELPQDRG